MANFMIPDKSHRRSRVNVALVTALVAHNFLLHESNSMKLGMLSRFETQEPGFFHL